MHKIQSKGYLQNRAVVFMMKVWREPLFKELNHYVIHQVHKGLEGLSHVTRIIFWRCYSMDYV